MLFTHRNRSGDLSCRTIVLSEILEEKAKKKECGLMAAKSGRRPAAPSYALHRQPVATLHRPISSLESSSSRSIYRRLALKIGIGLRGNLYVTRQSREAEIE